MVPNGAMTVNVPRTPAGSAGRSPALSVRHLRAHRPARTYDLAGLSFHKRSASPRLTAAGCSAIRRSCAASLAVRTVNSATLGSFAVFAISLTPPLPRPPPARTGAQLPDSMPPSFRVFGQLPRYTYSRAGTAAGITVRHRFATAAPPSPNAGEPSSTPAGSGVIFASTAVIGGRIGAAAIALWWEGEGEGQDAS